MIFITFKGEKMITKEEYLKFVEFEGEMDDVIIELVNINHPCNIIKQFGDYYNPIYIDTGISFQITDGKYRNKPVIIEIEDIINNTWKEKAIVFFDELQENHTKDREKRLKSLDKEEYELYKKLEKKYKGNEILMEFYDEVKEDWNIG